MRRRTLSVRIVAIVLATLLGLTGPGAALSHGVAHVRDHQAASHHEEHRAPLVHEHDGAGDLARDALAAPQEPADAHEHPRLDAPAITRFAVDAFLPAAPVLAPVVPVIVATVPVPPVASPLRLAEPPTGPPPPSRAPPLG